VNTPNPCIDCNRFIKFGAAFGEGALAEYGLYRNTGITQGSNFTKKPAVSSEKGKGSPKKIRRMFFTR
jgi:tRNA U34 2-thiouridine synthase MnmA/TrmU